MRKKMSTYLKVKHYHGTHKQRFLVGILVGAILLLSLQVADAAQSDTSEYQIKAASLVIFLKFVDWPQDLGSQSDPLIIGILGEDPFGDAFKSVENTPVLGNQKLVIKRFGPYKKENDITKCNLLFICDSERRNLEEILFLLNNSAVLTVSDVSKFVEQNGMIHLFISGARLGFDINQKAIIETGLQIRSALLQRARNVVRKDRERRN